jgi:hypothetical protein
MFHLLGINNSFLADLRTSFIENASMIKPEVVSIIMPEPQNLLKEAPLIHHIFNLSLANMQYILLPSSLPFYVRKVLVI